MKNKFIKLGLLVFACCLWGCVNVNENINYGELTQNSTSEAKTTSGNNENSTEYETTYYDMLATQPYKFGHSFKQTNEHIEFEVTSFDIAFDIGMIVFVNGIPQQYSDKDNNRGYILCMHVNPESITTAEYKCEFNNIPDAEKYVCRKNRLLMPQVLITGQRDFFTGHLHSISTYDASDIVQCTPGGNVDIGVIEGKKISFEESVSNTDILLVDAFDNNFSTPTVMKRETITGQYMLELTPDADTSYVISFWGNGEPVQVGEHMFYRVDMEQGSKYQYTFNIDRNLINSIDNFYAIACPVGEEGCIGKTFTKIFVDEYEG